MSKVGSRLGMTIVNDDYIKIIKYDIIFQEKQDMFHMRLLNKGEIDITENTFLQKTLVEPQWMFGSTFTFVKLCSLPSQLVCLLIALMTSMTLHVDLSEGQLKISFSLALRSTGWMEGL